MRMKRLLVLLCVCCLQGAIGSSQSADVRVDLGQAGKKVSPNQFGIFFEEINHAGDGGIYNELIRNGSFAEAPTMDGWAPLHAATAEHARPVFDSNVNLFFDTAVPLNAVKARSLRIESNPKSGERAGVSNEGFWGIGVKKGETYEFSMYARAAAGFAGPVTVTLEGKDGAVYGKAELNRLKPAWQRLTASIAANATDPAARLTISTTGKCTFWINMISLRQGKDLFRPDLLEKLKALKPGFMRFPGGTYVQGNERETAFRWKSTIGPREDRAGHQDAPWSYWSPDNMGFHEYLLLCEQLGAEPYYVSYAGMTWTPGSKSPFGVLEKHQIPVADFPLDQMGPIVEDALDAIEYANGPVTSKWGAARAKAGHPAPFGMKYVEIGNEDGFNPLYHDRYMLIYQAIKARYPDIQIIANESRRPGAAQMPRDLLDEHIYTKPQGALDMAKNLDGRERNGAKSVLAEYAVSTSGGFGNMRAALAEAVMLEGLERNGDVMPMASYAPLLANVHAINWRPDLIYFDSLSSYGTPSYYVQKMFADTRLETVVPVAVKANEMKLRMEGAVSARGSDAQAEFQDEKVTGSGDNYTYTVRARKTGGEGGLAIRFAIQDGGGEYLTWFLGVRHRASTLLVWGGGGNQDVPAHQLESSFAGALGHEVAGTIDADRWYDVKIEVRGRHVRCSLDGKQIHDIEAPESLDPSVYGAAGRTARGEIVLRLVNVSPVKQKVSIDLEGAGAAGYEAKVTRLTAADLDAENSLTEPAKVSPVEDSLPNVGNKFQYELEGNTFAVLKLTPQK
jgi:alpha-L-arabinofuranosidase